MVVILVVASHLCIIAALAWRRLFRSASHCLYSFSWIQFACVRMCVTFVRSFVSSCTLRSWMSFSETIETSTRFLARAQEGERERINRKTKTNKRKFTSPSSGECATIIARCIRDAQFVGRTKSKVKRRKKPQFDKTHYVTHGIQLSISHNRPTQSANCPSIGCAMIEITVRCVAR